MSAQAHNTDTRPDSSPRLVLITADEPDNEQAPQPLHIMGSGSRLTGNFRLTDR